MHDHIELFDKEEIYDNEIAPLMKQIIEICQKNQIPMLATFAYHNTEEEGVGLCTTLLNGMPQGNITVLQNANRALRASEHSTMLMTISKAKG